MGLINIKPRTRKAMHMVAMKQHNGAAMSKPNGLDPKKCYETVTIPQDQQHCGHLGKH